PEERISQAERNSQTCVHSLNSLLPTTPKDHTSLLLEYTLFFKLSTAIHLLCLSVHENSIFYLTGPMSAAVVRSYSPTSRFLAKPKSATIGSIFEPSKMFRHAQKKA